MPQHWSHRMRKFSHFALVATALVSTACYHVTVEIGRPAGGPVIERPWAASFIDGLVPPPVVETAAKCPNGIAKVDTQLSFLNLLVGGITFGIYTPMDIRVSCASRSAASNAHVISAEDYASNMKALEAASDEVAKVGEPVFVVF